MTGRGRLVAFEGGEGCGKSTQAARLAAALGGAVATFEPGATSVGRRIRSLVLDPALAALDERAEALLMAADRAQHVAEVIAPALAAGRDVVSDRYIGSTLAYQGFGRGLDVGALERISLWAAQGIEPDVVVLLDVPAAVARMRQAGLPDRMEAEDAAFHERVARGFRELAARAPDRWVVVDGDGSVDDVAARVLEATMARLAPGPGPGSR